MDLFDDPEPEPDSDDDFDTPDFDFPLGEPPPEDELEAQFAGQERAGCPGWSASAQRLQAAWRAFLAVCDPTRVELLERIEADSYRAARRRKVALAAIDAEQLPE